MFDDLERMDGVRLASTVLGLGGMVVASHVSLNTWIAVKSLTPPNSDTKEVTADAPLQPPVRGWRRVANKKLAAALGCALMPFCIQMFLIFILPKISSQGVMDAFWVTIEWLVISTMFDQMIICSPFISSSVQLINSKDNKSYLPKATRPNTRFHKIRPFVSGGLSAAVLFSASQGIKALYPLATLAFVMAMVFIPLPRISTKMTLLVLNGYFIGMPIVAGTIGYTVDLLVKYFSKSGDTDKPSTDTVPSDWVADAMLMFGSALPYVVGGFMASLALRYDHSKSSLPSALTLPAAPGEPVQIVNKRHLFRAPTFITALIALIGCMGTTIHFINQNAGMRSQFASEGLGLFLVVPVVSIAMLGCVGVRGNLREFWQYEEVWIPKKEEVTQISTATDVEAAGRASSEGEDEKDALITKAN